MIRDELDRELMKIEAIADILATVNAGELEKNTLVTFGAILTEACGKVRERVKDGGNDEECERTGR
jgi:hypothetical protein